MRKRVYVIVPAYNANKYIGGCLDSILKQSYQDLSVIVVDDASTDNTLDIIRQYSATDSRVICISSEINAGAASSRNKALSYVGNQDKNSFICFVDADDYIHPDYLQILINKQFDSKADIVWCQPCNTTKKYNETVFEAVTTKPSHDKIIPAKDLLLKEEYRIMYSMVWGKLFDARLWDNVRFPEDLRYYEDGATTFKAIYNADTVLITDAKLYYYYYSQNSATRGSSSIEKCDCGIATSSEKIDFYTRHNEKELLQMTYVGYANTILKNIRESDVIGSKEYKSKMRKAYKDIYLKAVRCNNIGIDQKIKFIIYRFFPDLQKYYISLKMVLLKRIKKHE